MTMKDIFEIIKSRRRGRGHLSVPYFVDNFFTLRQCLSVKKFGAY